MGDPLIDALRRVLADGPPLRLAILFGSRARGRAHARSDVDVAILPADADLTLAAEHRLMGEIERAMGAPVDLVRIDRARPGLRWRIARDGVVLHSDPPWEAARFRARAGIERDELRELERDARRRCRERWVREGSAR